MNQRKQGIISEVFAIIKIGDPNRNYGFKRQLFGKFEFYASHGNTKMGGKSEELKMNQWVDLEIWKLENLEMNVGRVRLPEVEWFHTQIEVACDFYFLFLIKENNCPEFKFGSRVINNFRL